MADLEKLMNEATALELTDGPHSPGDISADCGATPTRSHPGDYRKAERERT